MKISDQGAVAARPRRRAHTRLTAAVAAFALGVAGLLGVAAAPAPITAAGTTGAFTAASWDAAKSGVYHVKDYPGSMYWVTQEVTGAAAFWNGGYTGKGIDVALIDTGVVPVEGLATRGKLYHAPDFSFDTISDPLRQLDSYGHGTHLAGIIAGRDTTALKLTTGNETQFKGMAPDSRIVSVKAGDLNGVVDVSQVIAAIDWTVRNRTRDGLNIRVINLSYGTDGGVDLGSDRLVHAVERAWRAGITVVVAAGNDGNGVPLRNPALSPYVLAVGAAGSGYTYSTADDTVPSFSNCGTAPRTVDLVAPGRSIVSLRTPGSTVDTTHPEAVVADRFFLGSGTSQAAAVVSGAVALVTQQRPRITPDQVKALLMDTAQPIANAKSICQGAGLLDLRTAVTAATPKTTQSWPTSSGKASLEDARGSFHVELQGDVLKGNVDVHGRSYEDAEAYYDDGEGLAYFMKDWSGASWSGLSWSGLSWSGLSWSGLSWSGLSWSGLSWSGLSWSTGTWSGLSWKVASAL
jgi:serine protease AprX